MELPNLSFFFFLWNLIVTNSKIAIVEKVVKIKLYIFLEMSISDRILGLVIQLRQLIPYKYECSVM